MLEIDMNGRMKAIDIKGNWAFGSSSKLVAMYLEEKMTVIIIKRLRSKAIGTTDMTIFLPRLFPLATKVLIAIGSPS